MSTRTFVDPLGPVKSWLATQSISGCSTRVYIGDPERATTPYVALMLVDGPTDPGDAPVAFPRIQACAQADTELAAATAIWDLIGKAEGIDPGTRLDSTLVCLGARRVLGPIPRLDEAGPRYLADLEFTVVAR